MKKNSLLLITVAFFALALFSCKKDKIQGEKFSPMSIEENKAIIEDAGIEFVQSLNRMKSIETVGVIVNLSEILSSSVYDKKSLSHDSKVFSTLETFTSVAQGDKKINDLYSSMISSAELSDDPASIQEFWNESVGTYNWNSNTNDWDIQYGGTKIIVKFPSKEESNINDATLTISDYKGVIISNPLDDEYEGDLPVSLKADLKVGTKTLVTMTFGASYNSEGIPNSVASDLTIEGYKFEIDISNTSKRVSVNYKFSENGKTIIQLGASGDGLFTEKNINDNTNTVQYSDTFGYWDWNYNPATGQYEQQWVEYTYEWEDVQVDFEEILNSASAHFQLYNIALRGDINVKGLVDEIKLIEKDYDADLINDKTMADKIAVQINKHLNLRLVNVTNNEILAKAEAYVVKDIGYNWDDYYIKMRLKFGDGSVIDLDTYFEDGFNDFIDELNRFIDDINSEYAK
jgi:hypothetical protein